MAGQHGKTASWVVVGLLILAAVLVGLALPLESVPLGIAGGVIGVIGLIGMKVVGVMDDAT